MAEDSDGDLGGVQWDPDYYGWVEDSPGTSPVSSPAAKRSRPSSDASDPPWPHYDPSRHHGGRVEWVTFRPLEEQQTGADDVVEEEDEDPPDEGFQKLSTGFIVAVKKKAKMQDLIGKMYLHVLVHALHTCSTVRRTIIGSL